ncbi:type IV pili twitching motility protein PilT [Candidatus Daviesbacteria bacterium RIFCSPHIGHO2_12_FULL_37_11]|uniref:Type IV pili twitching motility protein PilT n=1 Tax=Candidatus Daviesbacteria bacterium RIFCSPHIGHO2_12_FULL_37_11 TaxID=1797777 RepID=A0A1F5KAA7_9BACT|nr:MAG: type IV pili twitching motility protein PilT [Candidatus Daviesbacteria bacterium GWA1_38_6]OGE37531.1 MAG: type IV pili twitching motility protein PilT [Candidatus Daviesbacteria bacterium RIFCSPHIGHO2_12_FULL_37_11]OGE45909.1 MAG: type IV pili twitching motility protein PilT [Candidatus Daviesbacteria bacterium RIFCSPLOWO2_01_FULL_37_10]
MTIQQLLELTIVRSASDLHLVAGFFPLLRVNGELFPVPGEEIITPSRVEEFINHLANQDQAKIFKDTKELDFSFDFQEKGRFRINLYYQKGNPAVSLRLIPPTIKSFDDLGLPKIIGKLSDLKQGFILVTGPTGHGKSTTIASLINRINQSRAVHVITIEDPIEYVYPPGKALISQREILSDTKGWNNALRAVLREDPDVVLIGEMRDLETIASAMTIAETGHLVFATLHTNSASQSIDRIIDIFPQHQQPQIRIQLASTLEAIISQRLISTINPGRVPAVELLFTTPAVRNMIREAKTYLIDNLIQTSAELGMVNLESSLASLVKNGKITSEVALKYALRPELLSKLLV